MGDLIDLKSPDGKTVVGTKLASPLIPVPAKTSNNDEKQDSNAESVCSSLNFVKRDSLDNNPFDNAFTKTVDYVRKQDDPFEVVLQKALTHPKHHEKVVTPKARNVGFKDDFTPKRRRYSDILKMNKTLDESLIDIESDTKDASKKSRLSPKVEEKSVNDSSEEYKGYKASVETKSELQKNCVIPIICRDDQSSDTSILHLSVMNDSLTESSSSAEDNLFKSMIAHRSSERIRDATADIDWLAVKNVLPKSQKSRRSLSQSDRMSPRKLKQYRSRSILEGLDIGNGNGNEESVYCAPSILFEDSMNKAFLQTHCGKNTSTLSNLSNISAITRLTSCSSGVNSSYSSNRTANCAFIESTGEKVDSFISMNGLGSNGSITKNSVQKSRLESDLDDLISKYANLKTKSSQASTNETVAKSRVPSIISGSGIPNDKSITSVPQEKLIDVDVFVPESNKSPPLKNTQRQSVSSSSSDSVFIDNDTNEEILCEAKNLAKTFEELAHRTSSTSTISDDLINSRLRWNFDFLPVSDDEDLVGDLIDLPKSPGRKEVEKAKSTEESQKLASSSDERSEKSIIKELETEFIDPEKKIMASTLLSDLEKLVVSENNPKAIELLKSLEKALGAKCGNNTELLETCFSTRNDLTKSPKKIENSLNIRDEIIEKSREDNTDVDTSESFKQLSLSDDKNLENNLNIRMNINKSDKSLMIVNEKTDEITNEKLQSNSKEESCDQIHDDSIDAIKKQNTITDEQKMAVELLVGLGKLLTGENKDPLTRNLLKNLGKALNLASVDNCGTDANIQSTFKETKRTSNRIGTPPRKSPAVSTFSRTANRRSLESGIKTKIATERGMRRSISTTQTPTSTTSSTPRYAITPLSADKSKAHLKEIRKRFSSDPGVPNPTDKKKSEIRAANDRNSSKDIALKPIVVTELVRQDKPSSTVVGCVKTKLRKKLESDVATKKGPMKAILPLGNMQRRGSLAKKISPLAGPITPPKPAREVPSAFTVTTSTPFPIVHLPIPTKSPKSKPMASSTPDDVGTKNIRRSISQIPPSPGKNSFLCNISPVTSKNNESSDDKNFLNDSKSAKPTKIVTPSKSRASLQLPKKSPMAGSKTSPKLSSRGSRRSDPQQSLLPRNQNVLKSPREKFSSKPLNLISKLRGRNASVNEKENCA